MLSSTPTTILFDAARQGDQEAFATLAQRRAGVLLALIRRMIGRAPHRADCCQEDLLQEALLRAWRLLPTANDVTALGFPRWLTAVTKNAVRDRISYESRRGKGRVRHLESVDGSANRLIADLVTISQAAAQRDDLVHALNALDRLPETQRSVVEAHVIDGDTIRQIAADLSISPNAVWERLQRGLRTMREQMPD